MGWFDEQIEFRKKHERELLSDSFENLAKAVTGRRMGFAELKKEADVSDAVAALLKYMGVKEKEEWNRQGVMLSRQTMSNWLLRCADDWLAPI